MRGIGWRWRGDGRSRRGGAASYCSDVDITRLEARCDVLLGPVVDRYSSEQICDQNLGHTPEIRLVSKALLWSSHISRTVGSPFSSLHDPFASSMLRL